MTTSAVGRGDGGDGGGAGSGGSGGGGGGGSALGIDSTDDGTANAVKMAIDTAHKHAQKMMARHECHHGSGSCCNLAHGGGIAATAA